MPGGATVEAGAADVVVRTDDWVTRNVPCGGLRTYWDGLLGGLRAVGVRVEADSRATAGESHVVHPSYYWPVEGDGPLVVTLHDTIYERDPAVADVLDVVPHVLAEKERLVRRADVVVVPSRAVAAGAATFYPGLAAEVVVVPHAVVVGPRAAGDGRRGRRELESWGITRPYLVHVGGRSHYKGFADLLKAYLEGPAHESWDLLVLGGRSRPSPEEEALLERHGSRGVVMTGRVGRSELHRAIAGAAAYVSATRAEGFGFGPLEAVACGTPAVVPPLPVLVENLGPACVTWSPPDPASLGDAVARVAGTTPPRPVLLDRRWENVATDMREVYERAALVR